MGIKCGNYLKETIGTVTGAHMKNIRKAEADDLARIAEIELFNYRMNFYPIFR